MQAEAKAADAAARLEELLSRTTQAWLPLWLEEHYNKASAHYNHTCCTYGHVMMIQYQPS